MLLSFGKGNIGRLLKCMIILRISFNEKVESPDKHVKFESGTSSSSMLKLGEKFEQVFCKHPHQNYC